MRAAFFLGFFTVGCVLVGSGCGGAEDPVEQPLAMSPVAGDLVLRPPMQTRTERVAFACRAPEVLFLNFDGVTLQSSSGCEDARRDCSAILQKNAINTTVAYPAFNGGAAVQQQVVDRVVQYYKAFNVQIVTTRPPSGNYSMVMIGGTPQVIGESSIAAGIALLDCGNQQDNNITFEFAEVENNDPFFMAQTIAQEAAHAFGLGHVSDSTDVMYPRESRGVTGFHDKTMTIPDGSGCGASQQNDVQLLTANVGAACPDGTAGSGGTAGAGGTGGESPPPPMAGVGGDGGGAGTTNDHNTDPTPGNLSNASTGTGPEMVVGGCAMAPAPSVSSLPLLLLLASGLLLALRRRHSR